MPLQIGDKCKYFGVKLDNGTLKTVSNQNNYVIVELVRDLHETKREKREVFEHWVVKKEGEKNLLFRWVSELNKI